MTLNNELTDDLIGVFTPQHIILLYTACNQT